ncbi:MAG: AAA family ATPase [Conexivisphaerales archaeon]
MTQDYAGCLIYVEEIRRENTLPGATSDIVALVGPRRAGKTYLMLKHFEALLKAGEQTIYASMEEPTLRRVGARKLVESLNQSQMMRSESCSIAVGGTA